MYQNLFSIEKRSLWDILKLYIEFFSKNPLLCIILITLLFLFCFGINRLFIWSLGLEINPESLSSYYIFVYTRLTYVSAMFFVFMLLYTPNREWNKVIGISVWIPLVSFNISLIHCFFLSPFPIKEVIADNIKAGITWLDDSWYEFRLAIYCIGSDLYNILTSLWLVLTTHIPSFTKILVTFPFFRRPFEILAIFYDYLVKVKLDQSRIHVAKNCGEFVYLPYKYTYYPLTEKLSKFTKIQIFDIIPNNDELYYNSFQLAVNSLKKNINILGDFCFTYNNSTHILSIITNMDVFDTYNNSVKSLGVSTELDLSKKSVYVYNKDLLREPLMNWCEKWILENTGWDKDKDLRISPKYPTYIFYSPKNQIILALTDPNNIGYRTNLTSYMEYNSNMQRSHTKFLLTERQDFWDWPAYKRYSICAHVIPSYVIEDSVELIFDSQFAYLDGYILNICNEVRDKLVAYYSGVNGNYNPSDVVNNFPISRVEINGGNSLAQQGLLDAFYRCDYGNTLPSLEQGDVSYAIFPFSDTYKQALENSLRVSKVVRFSEPTLLDRYPTFKRLIESSRSHRFYTEEISIDIQDQLNSMDIESCVILDRIKCINNPFVQITYSNYLRLYNELAQQKEVYDTWYGGENYHSNFIRWRLVFTRLMTMKDLIPFMNLAETRFQDAALNTIIPLRKAHASMYHLKAKASISISSLDHNELMLEVSSLLAKKPFEP